MLSCLGTAVVVLFILGMLVVAWPLGLALLFLMAIIAIVKGVFR